MLQFEHGAGGVAGGGDVQQLAVAPKVRVLSGKVWDKIPVGVAIEKRGLGSGEQSGALVNLIEERKSTRLNSSHVAISYAVFCLKKKRTAGIYNYTNTTTSP